eukprot:gene17348-12357_t
MVPVIPFTQDLHHRRALEIIVCTMHLFGLVTFVVPEVLDGCVNVPTQEPFGGESGPCGAGMLWPPSENQLVFFWHVHDCKAREILVVACRQGAGQVAAQGAQQEVTKAPAQAGKTPALVKAAPAQAGQASAAKQRKAKKGD